MVASEEVGCIVLAVTQPGRLNTSSGGRDNSKFKMSIATRASFFFLFFFFSSSF